MDPAGWGPHQYSVKNVTPWRMTLYTRYTGSSGEQLPRRLLIGTDLSKMSDNSMWEDLSEQFFSSVYVRIHPVEDTY